MVAVMGGTKATLTTSSSRCISEMVQSGSMFTPSLTLSNSKSQSRSYSRSKSRTRASPPIYLNSHEIIRRS